MSATTHRALVRRPADDLGRTTVEVAEVPTPRLEAGDVLLAPVNVGICGTDWQILRGLRDDPTHVLGHEGVAYVVESGASGLPEGTPVTVNPTHPEDPSFLLGHNLPGLWAERTRIPVAAVRAGLIVPVAADAAQPRVAALAEPLASARYGMRIARHAVRPAALVIWGDGIVGRLAGELWRTELPDLPCHLVGHGDDATDPSAAVLPQLLSRLPSPVVAVIATPRTGTQEALQELERHVPGTLLVDVHGGLEPGPIQLTAGDIDVAAIRAANCGGAPWPPPVREFARPHGRLLLCGHRGVAGEDLRHAVDLLRTQPDLGSGLLSHQVGLEEAADLVNSVLASGTRRFAGRRVLKAAIQVGGRP
ncbi:alcohol dehydrogenase catalytic domain-containing protein [Streptacidiphilus fuscans]|uniref:Alcohol dehydrogenase catalytic domain-containing protein n=1 Tax=Streptacidiphilus fuscans TaxID=2789292 RepID=A0A931B216_9ACTN|nr:alcohol dehydrogenase catalytic domain-containing protein [Streptacidiphilus fuscans]MBF9067501.1 alcohol dehydrogenase catalytic domain-containing protein [Streptacidiphilus fuscans]